MKHCIACGMPMRNKADFAASDMTKEYCVYCEKEDGTMKNFSEMVAGMTDFIVSTQGLDRKAAEKAAVYQLGQLPHWQSKEEL
ncbi:zinc ribbon domain-containing protein [Enterococcus sp. LJL128]